jgi:hypothetical protein
MGPPGGLDLPRGNSQRLRQTEPPPMNRLIQGLGSERSADADNREVGVFGAERGWIVAAPFEKPPESDSK